MVGRPKGAVRGAGGDKCITVDIQTVDFRNTFQLRVRCYAAERRLHSSPSPIYGNTTPLLFYSLFARQIFPAYNFCLTWTTGI